MNLTQDDLNDWELLEDLFEERAAIIEYDGGFSTYEAEQMAAQALGFDNKFDFKAHIQELKAFA